MSPNGSVPRLKMLYQQLIEAEATAFIGAAPFERPEALTTQRNGSRPRTLTTGAGDLNLKILKLRNGSFLPALLERQRRVDQAFRPGDGGLPARGLHVQGL